jgi:predicted small secreted protein
MKKVATVVITALLASQVMFLAACNTTEGAGKDIKSAGKAIEDTAKDAK